MFALLLAASVLTASPVADLAVDLDARAIPINLLPGAHYDVTVTNHGPDPLASATVTVQLEHPVVSGSAAPCVTDNKARTITCTFGPLAAGGAATMTGWVYYNLTGPAQDVNATATRTASGPADPNPDNDTDTRRCRYTGQQQFPPQPWPPVMIC